MSGVSTVTDRLARIGNCNSDSCCEQIAVLNGRIAALEGRVQTVLSTYYRATALNLPLYLRH
jgi:hypothetical protein